MNQLNLVNNTIKTIFIEPKLRDVLCSLYDNDLKPAEISSLLDIDLDEVEKSLALLCKAGLVTNKIKDGIGFYSITNTKVCDAILMLKDELYKVLRTHIGNQDY